MNGRAGIDIPERPHHFDCKSTNILLYPHAETTELYSAFHNEERLSFYPLANCPLVERGARSRTFGDQTSTSGIVEGEFLP